MLPRMLAVSGVGGSHVAAIQVSRITSHDLRVLHAGEPCSVAVKTPAWLKGALSNCTTSRAEAKTDDRVRELMTRTVPLVVTPAIGRTPYPAALYR